MTDSTLFQKKKKLTKDTAPIMGRTKETEMPQPDVGDRVNMMEEQFAFFNMVLDSMAADIQRMRGEINQLKFVHEELQKKIAAFEDDNK